MSPPPDESRLPEETIEVEVPIVPVVRQASDLAPRPQVSTAARANAEVDPELVRKARSWLSEPTRRESSLQESARAAGAKVRTGFAAVVDHLWVLGRRKVLDLQEDLRHRDRWFAWKAGVVAAWVALSLACLGIAGSGPGAAPRNRLDAYAVTKASPLSWALLVENRSGKPWTRVEIHVDGFAFRKDRVLPDERLVLGPAQFEAEGGAQPSADRPPSVARIVASEGSAEIPLAR